MYIIINRSSNTFSIYLTKFYTYQFQVTLWDNIDIPTKTNQPYGSGFSWESTLEFPDFTEFNAMFTQAGH